MATQTPRARRPRAAARTTQTAPAPPDTHDPDGGHGDVHDQLIAAVEETARLLEADGAMVYLLDASTGHLRFAHDAGIRSPRSRDWVRSIELPVGTGMFGRAVAERGVVVTGDYLVDAAIAHAAETDRVVADIGIRSMVAAPLVSRETVYGAIGAFSGKADAFSPSQIALVRALADHAAAAMANAQLIEALDHSRTELAERADAERALREITARISAAADLPAVLQSAVDEAARLLRADGARIDLIDPRSGLLRWAYASGATRPDDDAWPDDPNEQLDHGVSGQAVVLGQVYWTGDYLHDQRFPHGPGADTYIKGSGIHSVMAAPLIGEAGPFGALTVFADTPDAWADPDAALLVAIADQAAIAITNARLIDELDRSRGDLARTAEAERTLREIAARVSATHDQSEILQAVIDAAARLMDGTGATIDLVDREGMAMTWTTAEVQQRPETVSAVTGLATLAQAIDADPEIGLSGIAIRDKVAAWTGDYLLDERFTHSDDRDDFVREHAIRSVIATPLIHQGQVVGVLNTFADRPDAFNESDAGLLAALADQAAVAIANVRLIAELERSRAAIERRADTERSLRDITASIAALREPDAILERVVDEAKRLLGTDGAHLTRLSDDGTYLVPVVVEGGASAETERWLMAMEFPLGGGINGLAAELGVPVATVDYLDDDRIPQEREDREVAEQMGLRGMAAAPLRAPGGEVIGTLAISSRTPRAFVPDELDLLQGLADQAAIAITNTTLLERLTTSEVRYRFLVENSPDVVFATDAEGRFTFMSEGILAMTGFTPADVVGQHFSIVISPETMATAGSRWEHLMADPTTQQVSELVLTGRDGRLTPVEVHAIGIVDADGAFAGIHGATRDISDRERLQRELRGSEERYRYLVSSSPDLVWVTDADGRLTFVSESAETILGVPASSLIGRTYSDVFAGEGRREAEVRFKWLSRHPTAVYRSRLPLRHADGHDVLVEINGIGMVENGRFVGAHGAARDVSDRDRLERHLRRQAGELAAGEERAHLARELHDSVTQALFSMTLVSRSVELLLDRDVDAARTQITQLRELQREALAEMRALIFELRPGNLEQDGLTRALKTHTAALQGRIGLPVVVESDLDERLPLPIEEALYRIAQEALHNVVKHAAARQVRVEVGRVKTDVRLRISDDGKGFDPEQVPAGHLGLDGMASRAERIGATFTCRSQPGTGTTIEVIVPETASAAVASEPGTRRGPTPDPSIRDG